MATAFIPSVRARQAPLGSGSGVVWSRRERADAAAERADVQARLAERIERLRDDQAVEVLPSVPDADRKARKGRRSAPRSLRRGAKVLRPDEGMVAAAARRQAPAPTAARWRRWQRL
jgi:hypothetical protein